MAEHNEQLTDIKDALEDHRVETAKTFGQITATLDSIASTLDEIKESHKETAVLLAKTREQAAGDRTKVGLMWSALSTALIALGSQIVMWWKGHQ